MRPSRSRGGVSSLAIVGQVEVDHDQAEEADGDIEEEDDAPVEVIDDEAAGDRTEHRADQGGDGDEAHHADEFMFGKGADQCETSDGNHHGAAAALEHTAEDELMDVGGDAAEQGAKGEDADGGGEDVASAEAVGHPAADGDEDGKGESIAGQHGFHGQGGDAEGFGYDGDSGIEDGRVKRLHEKGNRDQPGEEVSGRRGEDFGAECRLSWLGRVHGRGHLSNAG